MNSVEIGPASFISAPFIKCPRCGNDSFGVAVIARHQYSRRCRECLYPTRPDRHPPFRLPKLDKKILYLDQFVISNFMVALDPSSTRHGPHDSFFREAFQRIDRLGKKQLLVCPSSEFHDAESLPHPCFEKLKQMYEHLSYGVRWHDTEQVQTYLIMEAFRNWLAGLPPRASDFTKDDHLYGERTGWTSHFYPISHLRRNPELVEEIQNHRDSTLDELKVIFEQWQKDKDKNFDFWVQEEVKAAARRYLYGFLTQLSNASHAQKSVLDSQQASIADAADLLLPGHESEMLLRFHHILTNQGVDEDKWLSKAIDFFQSEHFSDLPFVRFGASIWATVAYRAAHVGQKKPPNKGFYNDVSFVRTYYPYCDAMFLDKEICGILNDKLLEPVVNKCGTRLFSLATRDKFLAYLDKLESSASTEHVSRVKEVYGDDHSEPYTELYEGVE